MHGGRSSNPWTSEDFVLLLYLIIGAAGTVPLVALQSGIVDSLYPFMYFFLLFALIFNSLAWIPAVILIVVHRRSWPIVIPAATVIVSSISFFLADDPNFSQFILTAAFFPIALACGLVWAFRRSKKD